MVCAVALAKTHADFLVAGADSHILAKFVDERLDAERYEGMRLTGWPSRRREVATHESVAVC